MYHPEMFPTPCVQCLHRVCCFPTTDEQKIRTRTRPNEETRFEIVSKTTFVQLGEFAFKKFTQLLDLGNLELRLSIRRQIQFPTYSISLSPNTTTTTTTIANNLQSITKTTMEKFSQPNYVFNTFRLRSTSVPKKLFTTRFQHTSE